MFGFFMISFVGKLIFLRSMGMDRIVTPFVKSRFDLNMTVRTKT